MRKRLPIAADWKLKILFGGLARLRISKCRWEKIDLISSAWDEGSGRHSSWVPSSIAENSIEARAGSDGNRWLKRL